MLREPFCIYLSIFSWRGFYGFKTILDDWCCGGGAGWHLPSKKEFESLFKTVGGDSIAGEKLKFTDDWL